MGEAQGIGGRTIATERVSEQDEVRQVLRYSPCFDGVHEHAFSSGSLASARVRAQKKNGFPWILGEKEERSTFCNDFAIYSYLGWERGPARFTPAQSVDNVDFRNLSQTVNIF